MKKILIPTLFLFPLLAFAEGSALGDDIVIFEGDTSNELLIHGDANEDTTLYFGDSLSHFLRWDADRNIFVFSDNVDFGGNQLLNMRIENLENSPLCDTDSSGRLYYNTNSNQSFVCNGAIWKQIDEEALSVVNPYIQTLSPASANALETTTLVLSGGGFSLDTTVIIPGFEGSIGAVTVVSPTEITFDVTPSSEDSGNFDIILSNNGVTNSTWNGNGVDILEVINTVVLIPAQESVVWERESGVVTSVGKLLPSIISQGWGKGASFGFAPANTDFVLSFDPVYMLGQTLNGYAMFGVDNSDPDREYQSIDYAFYIAGNQLSIYENGVSRGTFGDFSVGDTLSILREGSIVKYAVNDTVVYTSSVSSSSQMVFDSSIYRWLGAENIRLEY